MSSWDNSEEKKNLQAKETFRQGSAQTKAASDWGKSVKPLTDAGNAVVEGAKAIPGALVENYKRTGEGFATLLAEADGTNEKVRKQQDESSKEDIKLIKSLGEKIKGAKTDEEKQRYRDALGRIMDVSDKQAEDFQAGQADIIDKADPTKNAAALAGIGLDIVTAGTGGAAIKGGQAAVKGAETGLKIASRGDKIKDAATAATQVITNPQTVKQTMAAGGAIGAAQGGLGVVEDQGADASVGDIATGAVVGGGTGAALGGIVKGIADELARRKGGAPTSRVDEVKAAETPFAQAVSMLDPDAQARMSQAVAQNPEIAAASLSMNPEQATALITQVEGNHAKMSSNPSLAPEEKITSLTPGSQPQNANLSTLEQAATANNPAEYMAAEVTPGSPTLTMDVPKTTNAAATVTPGATNDMRVNAADVLTPEEQAAASLTSAAEPKPVTTRAGQELVNTIEEQRKGLPDDVNLKELDSEAIGALRGSVKDSKKQAFFKGVAKNAEDPITYLSQRAGKEGADFGYGMAQGAKFKTDQLDALRQPLDDIQKLSKKVYGDSEQSKIVGGENMIKALSDRENAAKYLNTPEEMSLFEKFQTVFDHVKELRQQSGLSTLEDYAPWARLGKDKQEPTWLADAFTGDHMTPGEDIRSRFSKHRESTEMGDDVDTNLSDSVFGYVNSQLNELAYMEPVVKFQESQGGMNAAKTLNKQGANEARNYMERMVRDAISPEASSGLSRTSDKIRSNVYQNVLRGNIKTGLQNYSQLFISNSEVSGKARSVANRFSKEETDEIMKDVAFGKHTITADASPIDFPTSRTSKVNEAIDKIDPYARSEATSVKKPYLRGYAQGLMDSPAYKDAIKSGKGDKEALQIAKADPQAKVQAARRGNVLVNNTSFGANTFARPEALRNPKVFGSKTLGKALTMFTRFPIGMSQHVVEQMQQKSTRALDMFRYGDPRGVPLAEMRDNYKALSGILDDAMKAGDSAGVPKDVLKAQADMVKMNVKTIDGEIKKISQRRGGKSTANLAKMWAAAAAIQYAFDAGGSLLTGEDSDASVGKAIDKSDPTVLSWTRGQGSKLSGFSSPLSPVNKYGQPTSRPVLNMIPGAGIANRVSGNGISDFIDDKLRGK
jgi:hypothetical protein